MIPVCVLWIDPGGMTGLASLGHMGTRFHADEYPFREACDRVYGFCSYWKSALAIGWERFTITSQTHKKSPQPEALEVIGVARWLAMSWGCQILTPAQQHTPGTADREQLQAIGWWVPGKDDAQSAACHMLRWLLATQNLPAREAGMLAEARSR
jgi:hypothetical protein